MSASRVNILGVGISATTLNGAVETIEQWRTQGQRQYVSTCTVHTLMECRRSPELRRRINAAGLAAPDGMPLVWISHRLGHPGVTRVYGPDLMLALCHASAKQPARHFFYGGAPGVPERLAQRLKQRFPGLEVAGTLAPPFRALSPEEDEAIVASINATRPDIVWVGLGTPRQDYWVAGHCGRIDAAALIAVGAAFDFLSGHRPQAPLWMQRQGLEWSFRLAHEPGRLWRRYLVDNILFLGHISLQLSGARRYPMEA